MRSVIYLVVLGYLIGGCSYVNQKIGLSDDHFIEESMEGYIENKTGIDIDLSPKTPESLS